MKMKNSRGCGMTKYMIFDIHHHVGALDTGGGGPIWKVEGDYTQRVQIMDKFGVRAAAVMPSSQYLRPNGIPDTCALNDLVADYRNRYRDRFPVALGTVEPLHGEEAGVQEIRRLIEKLHMNGVVWHHRFQGTFINDKRMHPLLRTLAEYQVPAFIHLFGESAMEDPWGLEALAEEHPQITFVALDAFSGSTQSKVVMRIAKRCPNVFLETGITFPLGRIIEEVVANIGSERVLFGTDLYVAPLMYLHPDVLYQILDAPTLTDQDKHNIFWNNAQRLFKLEV
jgi:predicted TIM-barrel fold metal-dependent hydrolase